MLHCVYGFDRTNKLQCHSPIYDVFPSCQVYVFPAVYGRLPDPIQMLSWQQVCDFIPERLPIAFDAMFSKPTMGRISRSARAWLGHWEGLANFSVKWYSKQNIMSSLVQDCSNSSALCEKEISNQSWIIFKLPNYITSMTLVIIVLNPILDTNGSSDHHISPIPLLGPLRTSHHLMATTDCSPAADLWTALGLGNHCTSLPKWLKI